MKHGMDTEIDNTTKVWKSLPQAHKTDWEFMQYLCNHENGDYMFYVTSNTLYLKKIDYAKKAKFLFTYGDGSSVISFKPSYRQSQQNGAANGTKAMGFDPMNKNGIYGANGKENTLLGNHGLNQYDVNGNRIEDQKLVELGLETNLADFQPTWMKDSPISKKAPQVKEKPVKVTYLDKDPPMSLKEIEYLNSLGDEIEIPKGQLAAYQTLMEARLAKEPTWSEAHAVVPAHTQTEADLIANSMHKRGGGPKILCAKLALELNPIIRLNEVLTMANVAKKHQGNWMVEKVTHTIGKDYASTGVEMHKTGTHRKMSSGATKTDKANNTVGESKVADKTTLRVYDVNAKRLADK
jgi:hypothetical protein